MNEKSVKNWWNKRFVKNWGKTRSKGKKHYIIIHTLTFTIAGILYSIFNYYFSKVYNNFNEVFWGTIIYICVFFVVGLSFGSITWELCSKIYKKLLKD